MKILSKSMQGASKSTGKSLDLQGFFACLKILCPTNNIYKIRFIFSKNFLKITLDMERVPEFILVSKSKRGHLYENQTYFL